jgi:hypothetical protein
MASSRRIRDLLPFEEKRITMGISQQDVAALFPRWCANPFVFNATARLAAVLPDVCSFCGEEQTLIHRYTTDPIARSLIRESPDGELGCCFNCHKVVQAYANFSTAYRRDHITNLPAPIFSPRRSFFLKTGPYELLSSMSTASFTMPELSVLFLDGMAPVHIASGSELVIVLHRTAILGRVVVQGTDVDLTFSELEFDVKGNGVYEFPKTPTVKSLAMTVVGECDIAKFELWGVFFEEDIPPVNRSEFAEPKNIAPIACEWIEDERTAIYRFDSVKGLLRVGITIVDPNVTSLVFCFLVNKALGRCWERVKLPVTKANALLVIGLQEYPFDTVYVFYDDPLPKITPHYIGFLCGVPRRGSTS